MIRSRCSTLSLSSESPRMTFCSSPIGRKLRAGSSMRPRCLYAGASVTTIGRIVVGCAVVFSSCPRLVSACMTPQGEGAAIEIRPELTLSE